ncbi:hypothetical protein [Sphaerisporangium sp. NPDC051011]|uniref:hypothetical protein n=1 Tax=Sphaerisporangium sp. NPDC051011 TaxID=3155792 RepID=UPI0033FA403D
MRFSHFVVAYYELVPGDAVPLLHAASDRIVLVPHDDEPVTLDFDIGRYPVDCAGMFVAAGPAILTAHANATVIEAAAFADLAEVPEALNEPDFADPVPGIGDARTRRVPGLQAGVRFYPMAPYPPTPGRFGRIIASSNIMANLLETEREARDVTRLSPHSHADFEQCCITTKGSYVHHWRTPWTSDLREWSEDLHLAYDSPAIAVIPPGVVHTANSVSRGPNQMIDVFSPPRQDFTAQGWVLNPYDSDLPAAAAALNRGSDG